MDRVGKLAAVGVICAIPLLVLACMRSGPDTPLEGFDLNRTDLVPSYPDGYDCSPLTSLYGSWIDLDGSRRDEPHSGVDGGREGEDILAPADGTVVAAWRADWGSGPDGALLILHSPKDLNLKRTDGPSYYSEFDHLKYDEIAQYQSGQRIGRGEKLATVSTPGGNRRFRPEVHWEVWEVSDDAAGLLVWDVNRKGKPFWLNSAARLIDPLYLLSLQDSPKNKVSIRPNDAGEAAKSPLGLSYILPCPKSGEPVSG